MSCQERDCRGHSPVRRHVFIHKKVSHSACQATDNAQCRRSCSLSNSVRAAFARIADNDPLIDRALVTFLGRAYNLKAIADYAVGSDARIATDEAEHAIATAQAFVDAMAKLI